MIKPRVKDMGEPEKHVVLSTVSGFLAGMPMVSSYKIGADKSDPSSAATSTEGYTFSAVIVLKDEHALDEFYTHPAFKNRLEPTLRELSECGLCFSNDSGSPQLDQRFA